MTNNPMNEALEPALQTWRRTLRFDTQPDEDGVGDVLRGNAPEAMRAAIVAFLRNCPVTDTMHKGFDGLCAHHFPEPPPLTEIWSDLRTTLADEIEEAGRG